MEEKAANGLNIRYHLLLLIETVWSVTVGTPVAKQRIYNPSNALNTRAVPLKFKLAVFGALRHRVRA